MIKYVLKRSAMMMITFFIIMSLVYIVATVANLDTWYRGYSKIEFIKMAIENYFPYLKGIFTRFDFGMYYANVSTLERVMEEIPTTFKINLYAFIFYTVLGIVFGFISAYFHKSLLDKIISYITLVLGSVPGYVTMLFLMLYFGYKLGWFPGRFDPDPEGPYTFFQSITLPILALSAVPISRFTRILRGELIETMGSEFLLLARAKGLNKKQVMFRHALKNSLIPMITEIPMTFSLVLSMSFIIEITYNIRGAAFLLYESFITPSLDGNYLSIDVETSFVICGFYVGMVMILTLISDLSYALIDPRMRMGQKKTKV